MQYVRPLPCDAELSNATDCPIGPLVGLPLNSATGGGGPALAVTTSCGGLAATSRVAKTAESVPALLIANATGPLPGTADGGA